MQRRRFRENESCERFPGDFHTKVCALLTSPRYGTGECVDSIIAQRGGGRLAMADNSMRKAATKVLKDENSSQAAKGLKRPPSHRHDHTDAAPTGQQGSSQATAGHTA